MSRSRRNLPPNSGGLKSKLDKSKKENMHLRVLAKRQRRNIKDLAGVIVSAQRAVGKGDMLRVVALISTSIKYPPAMMDHNTECDHTFSLRMAELCVYCGEERK